MTSLISLIIIIISLFFNFNSTHNYSKNISILPKKYKFNID